MSTLTPDQQKVLRSFGGWMLAELFIEPDGFKTLGGGSSTCAAFEDEKYWLNYTGSHVEVTNGIGGEVVAKVTWAQAKRYARTIPGHLVDALLESRRERRAHQSTYPEVPLKPRGDAGEEAQQAYADAFAEYSKLLKPWIEENDYLTGTQEALLDQCLPGATGLCVCTGLAIRPHVFVDGLCSEVA